MPLHQITDISKAKTNKDGTVDKPQHNSQITTLLIAMMVIKTYLDGFIPSYGSNPVACKDGVNCRFMTLYHGLRQAEFISFEPVVGLCGCPFKHSPEEIAQNDKAVQAIAKEQSQVWKNYRTVIGWMFSNPTVSVEEEATRCVYEISTGRYKFIKYPRVSKEEMFTTRTRKSEMSDISSTASSTKEHAQSGVVVTLGAPGSSVNAWTNSASTKSILKMGRVPNPEAATVSLDKMRAEREEEERIATELEAAVEKRKVERELEKALAEETRLRNIAASRKTKALAALEAMRK